MQYLRWSEGTVDTDRQVLARLAWNRPAVQRQLMKLRNVGEGALFGEITWRQALKRRTWEAALCYSASYGLVLSLESELGSGGMAELFKELLADSPETDREMITALERHTGRKLFEIGRMTREQRRLLLDGVRDKAAAACGAAAEGRDIDLIPALGHFPEQADANAALLLDLVECPDEAVSAAALVGLVYLGRMDPVREALARLDADRNRELRRKLEREGVGLEMAKEFVGSPRRARRWFGREWR